MELLWIWLLLAAAEARREYLLDTTRMDNLDWTTFTQHSGWREASFTSSSGTGESQTFRVYAVCEVAQEDVNNWLRTPYISRKHANRIYIETKFTMRECTRHPNPNHLQQCKEKFNLLYYEADSNFANAMMPTWDTMSYRHIDAIAADREFSDINNAAINTKTRDISVTLNGLYFAYQDTGACTSLISVKVYYVLCDAITIKFARFEKTVTGPELTSIVQQTGQCVENAEEESKPTYLCRADGTWYLNDGGCQCKAGYQPDKSVMGGACMECKPGTYKWQIGGERCEACPDKSFTHHRKSTECKCLKGYYRDNNDLASVPCAILQPEELYLSTVDCYRNELNELFIPVSESYTTQDGGRKSHATVCTARRGDGRALLGDEDECTVCEPPSAPRNISGRFVDQNMAILQWLGPERDGGRKDIYYSVECRGCSNQVRFTPNKDRLTQTRVTLSDLKPSTTYKVTVYSRNGVSKASQTAWDFYQTIDFTTEASVPSKVMNVHIIERGPNYIVLGWEKPRDANKIEKYEIKYFSTNEASNMSAVQTTALNYAFRDLKMLSKFGFQVRAKTSRGWGKYSKTFYTSTSPRTIMSRDKGYGGYGQEPNNRISSKVKEEGNPVGIIVGAIVAVSVCMIIIIVIFFIILRRNNTACSEKSPADNNMPYGNMQCGMYADYAGSNIMSLNGMMTLPLYHQAGTIRTYVDPHTYEDPTQAVREFTKEIDASHITIETVIGGGEFGDVCKGKLRMPSQSEKSVAIKTLKPGATDQNRLDFLTEASIMGQFEDPNVIYLGGVVTKSHPIMIVTEYMANGSLDTFLRNNDGQFTVLQLTAMLRGIAAGMKYLSECGYVHRDLAARNILVNENLVCKVADFGLSRVIEADTIDGAYTTKGGKIPVRWTAPEAIAYRKFTSSSDVWSYGVVMWEVISYGERPYWNWSNQDVIKAVDNGFRLPPPMDCPDAVFQLMLDCWQKERGHRPKFALLVLALDKLIQAPELLLRLAQYRQPDIQNCSFEAPIPDFAHCATVEEWLTLIKMDRYIDTFHTMGYISIDEVLKLNSKDLLSMGINLIGHQRKILNSIQCLNHQMNGTVVNYDPLSDCAYSVGRLPVTDLFV